MSDRLKELERLNASHPHYQAVPVFVMGVHWRGDVVDRCFVRKLNGRSNAFRGWIPIRKLQLLSQEDADGIAALRGHLQKLADMQEVGQ